MIKVVNKKTHIPTEQDVYIGRGSVLGNKFTHITMKETKAEFIVGSRSEAIQKHKEYLTEQIKNKEKDVCDELNRIWKLAKEGDVNLACYCFPKKCHGDFIKSIIEQKL